MLIAFATSAGEVAYDGTGINSPYSSALANALQTARSRHLRHVPDRARRCPPGDRRIADPLDHRLDRNEIRVPGRWRSRQRSAGSQQVAEAGNGLTIDEVLWSFIKDSPEPGRFRAVSQRSSRSSRFAEEATEKSQVQMAALSERGRLRQRRPHLRSDCGRASWSSAERSAASEGVRLPAGRRTRRQRDVSRLAEPSCPTRSEA